MYKQIVLFVVLSIAFIAIAGCCGASDVSTTPKTTDSTSGSSGVVTSTSTPNLITASMNEALVVKTGGDTFEITVNEVIRGQQVNTLLKQANMFNSDPSPGNEFMLVNVKKTFVTGSGSDYASSIDFTAYADGAGYSQAFAVLPDAYPEFRTATLMPGGSTQGWILYEVPTGSSVKLAYNFLMSPVGFIQLS